ncbi:MAG: hypothetical protein IJX99_01625 [Clostridia bacterium]|nr:hypothetical protein [Clostridia bacterium]
MSSQSFVSYNDLREQILLLNFAQDDSEIIRYPRLSTSMLDGVRRQFNLATLYEALEKHLEFVFEDGVSPEAYESFCKFMMKNDCEGLIRLIPDEELRIKYLKRVLNPAKKADILVSISNDDIKMKFLSGFSNEIDKVRIICSMNSDDNKIKMLPRIKDFHKQARIIASLDDDAKKLEYIYSGHVHPSVISDIIFTLKDDSKKEELISLIPSDTARFRVILGVKDPELKKRLFSEYIRSAEVRKRKYPEFVLSLPISEQLQNFSDFEDNIKFLILRNCDLDTQIKLMGEIKADEYKRRLLEIFSDDELTQYLDSRFGNTENYWVRTDSKEKDPNIPRDSRLEVIEEIIKYSNMLDGTKIALIHRFVKDKDKAKELLKLFDFETVISEFFQIKDDAINIKMLEYINADYDITELNGIKLTADRFFDFDDPKNLEMIEFVKSLHYPEFILKGVPHDLYYKWKEVFDDSDMLITVKDVEVDSDVDLDTLADLTSVTKYFIVNSHIVQAHNYCLAKELIEQAFPVYQDANFDKVRSDIELALSTGQIGHTLVEANSAFEQHGFTEEQKQNYGERLFEMFYNRDPFMYPGMYLALNEESVDLFHKWDKTHQILARDFSNIVTDMTKAGIKRTAELLVGEGLISEEFGISYILNYLSEHHIPDEGIKYGERIVQELLHEQNLGVENIKTLNPGAFSDVFMVGDFVVKLGLNRETKKLPVHDRILPSVLRFEVTSSEDNANASNGGVKTFIEVQPYVKLMNLEKGSTFGDEQPETFEVFSDLRHSDIFWGDVAKRNLGYVDKVPNISARLFSGLKEELDESESVTVYHDNNNLNIRASSDDAPYYFVIDTDFLYQITDDIDVWQLRMPSIISYEYEHKYEAFIREKGRADIKPTYGEAFGDR